MTISNEAKNSKTLTNIETDNGLTWDEATMTWDEAERPWDAPGRPITKELKNGMSLNPANETGGNAITQESKNNKSLSNESENV